jgi:hypothetical protein
MDGVVEAIIPYDGKLVAGGDFRRAGALRTRNVAAWDGSRWDSLGPGLTFPVSGLTRLHGSLIAATGRSIKMWDGRAWSSIAEGGGAWALSVFQGDLIAAGYFRALSGVPAQNIARWDGLSWMPLAEGIGRVYTAQLFCLAVADSSLYVGGTFSEAGRVSADGLARWDGESWSEVGSGEGGSVLAMAIYRGELVVARSNRLRTWNGRRWAALAQADNRIMALAVHDGWLIAGGAFTRIGDVAAKGLAAWDGVAWTPLGSGVDWTVEAIASFGPDLYVGGLFRFAGGKGAHHVGCWRSSAAPGGPRILTMRNPYRPGDPIDVALEGSSGFLLEVFDLQGRRVRTLWEDEVVAGPVTVRWDGSSNTGDRAPQGLYFLHGHAGSRPIGAKILLLRP